jgi:hypothetical protein
MVVWAMKPTISTSASNDTSLTGFSEAKTGKTTIINKEIKKDLVCIAAPLFS